MLLGCLENLVLSFRHWKLSKSLFGGKEGLEKGCNNHALVYNTCGKRIYEFKVLTVPSSKKV